MSKQFMKTPGEQAEHDLAEMQCIHLLSPQSTRHHFLIHSWYVLKGHMELVILIANFVQ